jgi:hypothetical protein
MPDKKDIRYEEERSREAFEEKWEVDDLIQQIGATRKEIAEAIRLVGNDRDKVEEYLRNKRVF